MDRRSLLQRSASSRAGRWRALIAALLLAAGLPWAAAPARAESISANVTVVLVIDNSGSMTGAGGNDPAGLRFAAAKLFVQLLDVGDVVGAVHFSDDAQPVPLRTIEDQGDKDAFAADLATDMPGGATDMQAAFAAARDLLAADDSGNEPFIVFLTDGEPDPDEPVEFGRWWEDTRAIVRETGARVLAIALTSAADTPYLNDVAVESGGAVFPAADSSHLAAAYLEVFGNLKGRTVREPLPGATAQQATFAIPPSILRAYFVVIMPDGQEAPDPKISVSGKKMEVTPWSDQRFSVATVEGGGPLDEVPVGEWTVSLDKPATDIRAILVSAYEVVIDAPIADRAPLGAPLLLSAYLAEVQPDGSLVRLDTDSFVVNIAPPPDGAAAEPTLRDDGSGGDAVAGDLLYSATYGGATVAGEYTLTFQATRGGIQTSASKTITVEPFPRLMAEEIAGAKVGDTIPLVAWLDPNGATLSDVVANVTADFSGPNNVRNEVTLTSDGDRFTGAFTPDAEGTWTVTFTVRGSYKEAPFNQSITQEFEVDLVERIVLAPDSLDFGTIANLAAGATVTINVTSTSPRDETLRVSDSDHSERAFILTPETIRPGTTSVTVRLTSSERLGEGIHRGTLVFEGADVPVEPAQIAYTFSIAPSAITLGGPSPIDFGAVDGDHFANGFTLQYTVNSTAPAPATLTARLEFDAGATCPLGVAIDRAEIAPGGPTPLALRFTANELDAGACSGRVVFDAGEQVSVEPSVIPFSLTVRQPGITILSPEAIDLGDLRSGDLTDGRTVAFTIASTVEETVTLRARLVDASGQEVEGIVITLDPAVVPGNSPETLVTARVQADDLSNGSYEGTLVVSADPPVAVTGGNIPFNVEVVPWWRAHLRTFALGLLAVVAALVAAALIYRRIPRPKGTLACVDGPDHPPCQPLRFATKKPFFPKHRLTIGRDPGNHFRIDHNSIEKSHAVVEAERGVERRTVGSGARQRTAERKVVQHYLRNVGGGEVRVNGSPVSRNKRQAFKEEDQITLGEYTYTYR